MLRKCRANYVCNCGRTERFDSFITQDWSDTKQEFDVTEVIYTLKELDNEEIILKVTGYILVQC